jgi:signal peptidase II
VYPYNHSTSVEKVYTLFQVFQPGCFDCIIFKLYIPCTGLFDAYGAIPIVKDIFHLTYARNTGAAFSILRDKQAFLILVTTIVVGALIYYLIKILKTGEVAFKLSLAIIIGGALGNLIDRVRLNYVTDFLDFTLINYPIFNLADVFVVSGVVMLSYMLLFKGDMPKISKM